MLRRNQKVELIRKAPLFAHCSKRELEQIAQIADEIDLREGKEMTRQGSPGREFFVLLEGDAAVDKDGRRINTLGPGDFFGEIALLESVPRTATVRAEGIVRLLVVGHREFHALMGEFPAVRAAVLDAVAERLRSSEGE